MQNKKEQQFNLNKFLYTLEDVVKEAPLSAYKRQECNFSIQSINNKFQELSEQNQAIKKEIESVRSEIKQIKAKQNEEKTS